MSKEDNKDAPDNQEQELDRRMDKFQRSLDQLLEQQAQLAARIDRALLKCMKRG